MLVRGQRAIWHQSEVDVPVIIVKFLDFDKNGESWYLVQGTMPGYQGRTGAPGSELSPERVCSKKRSNSRFN